MSRNRVYDLPTRVFHWVFAVLFFGAWVIGKTVDDESSTFPFHMLMGMTLSFVVVLRILWGFFGTRYAKFSGFSLRPGDQIRYFKGVLSGSKERWAGHNPASSWAALLMILLALGMGITGYLMISESPGMDEIGEIHELLANAFIVVVIGHIAGVILHTIRHRDAIGLSMVDGKKDGVADSDAISSARPAVGFAMLALVLLFAGNLYAHYDVAAKRLSLFGATYQLGESEKEEAQEEKGQGEAGDRDEKEERSEQGDHDED